MLNIAGLNSQIRSIIHHAYRFSLPRGSYSSLTKEISALQKLTNALYNVPRIFCTFSITLVGWAGNLITSGSHQQAIDFQPPPTILKQGRAVCIDIWMYVYRYFVTGVISLVCTICYFLCQKQWTRMNSPKLQETPPAHSDSTETLFLSSNFIQFYLTSIIIFW